MKSFAALYPTTLQASLQHHATANKLAIVWEDEQGLIQRLMYDDLYQRVLAQAATLQTMYPGIGKGRQGEIRVGIWLPRTADFVTSFLSIWVAGFVYVPISDTTLEHLNADPVFKSDFELRVRALDPFLDVIITDTARIVTLQALASVRLIDVDELRKENTHSLTSMLQEPQAEAFVFCSSGTTGTPKIAAIPYEGISDRVQTVIQGMNVTGQDCILQYTGFDFDPSLMEMIMALQFGIPLIIAPEVARLNPHSLVQFFEKLSSSNIPRPNIAIIVPSMLKLIPPSIFENLKSLMTTGENILPKDLVPWFDQHPQLRIFTGYGPTETTWGATLTEITRDPICIHITKPMQGIELKLLPAEDGIHEILIGGNGQGYYLGKNAEAQTQKNWLDIEGKRYFRPHDGVSVEEGKILYSGRIDDLIKYHGKWVSLEIIDAIAENFLGVQHATTISISGTSMVFVFLVLQANTLINIADLESYFRQETGGVLFPVFFTEHALKFNGRGKRCRQLKNYPHGVPLSQPKGNQNSLSIIWTQALAEIDPLEAQAAFSQVGIEDYQSYFPQYAADDRFDYLGGRSIKFSRLINLLWNTYFQNRPTSQQRFRLGLLRHQSFQDMSEFVRMYQAVQEAFTNDQQQTSIQITCLWLNIPFTIPEAWQEEFCELLSSEIKAVYPTVFYHLIMTGYGNNLFSIINANFNGRAVVDDAMQITSRDLVEKYCTQYVIKSILLRSTPPVVDGSDSTLQVSLTKRTTLLGSACGKTSFLLRQHELLKQAGKIVCYVSCRELVDEENNLPKYLGLSQAEWEIFCEGSGSLAEVTWLIDDLEFGILDQRLEHLEKNLTQYKGDSSRIYAGRENFYPFCLNAAERYGEIHRFKLSSPVELDKWFDHELNRSKLSTTIFLQQLTYLVNQFKQRKFIYAETNLSWWKHAEPLNVQNKAELPPLYLSQYPTFSSLVRFLTLHDDSVYELERKYQVDLEAYLAAVLSRSATNTVPELLNLSPSSHSKQSLPAHIRHFPGDAHLSPWICFHSISGNCPEGYSAYAESIYAETHQATITFSMPANVSWESLEAQVASYLAEIEHCQLVPAGAPYYLLGWSYGGFVAVEAARQLEKMGKVVAVVVNLDAAPLFASTNFPWDSHHQYVSRHIRQAQDAAVLENGMTENFRLLRKYCESRIRRAVLKAKHYIFEATLQPETFREVVYQNWMQTTRDIEHFRCECDHFGIFADGVFRSQFLKILIHHREQSDLRSFSLKRKEKSATFLKEQELANSTLPNYVEPLLEKQIHEDFLKNAAAPDYLVIEGEPGVGKSRLMLHLTESLLRDPSDQMWFPILIPMRLFLGTRDINTVLQMAGYSSSDLREAIRFLFIFDAVDESDVDLKAYSLRLAEFGKNSKVILTIRKGYSLQFSDRSYHWELPILDETMLKKWLQQLGQAAWSIERLFESPKLSRDWLKTPLALSLILRLHQAGKSIEPLIENSYALYETLDNLAFEKYCSQEESRLAYEAYCKSFAIFEPVPVHSRWNYPDQITQCLKKAAHLLEQHGKLVFSHNTWRDFQIVRAILNEISAFKPFDTSTGYPYLLSHFQLIDLPKTGPLIILLRDFWKYSSTEIQFSIRKQLFSIALFSRHNQNDELVCHAARTAMEILNIFGQSFSALNLAETQFPNGDLSQGLFHNTNFSRSNLRGANFSGANLAGAKLQGAALAEIECGELPPLSGNAFCYNVDGEYLLVADKGTLKCYFVFYHEIVGTSRILESGHLAEINNAPKKPDYQQRYMFVWERYLSEQPIKKIIVSADDMIACCTDHECFVGYLETCDLAPFQFDNKILNMLFSPKADEIAILSSNALLIQPGKKTGRTAIRLTFEMTEDEFIEPVGPHQNLGYSCSGSELAFILEKEIYVWSAETQSQIEIPNLSESPKTALAYHPTRDLLFVLLPDEVASIDLNDHTVTHHYSFGLYRPTRFPGAIVIDVQQNRVLVSCMEFLFEIKIDSNQRRDNCSFISFDGVRSIALSPSGDHIAVQSQQTSVHLMDRNTHAVQRKLGTITSNILGIAYHPSGRQFAVLTADNTIRSWSLVDKACLQQFYELEKYQLGNGNWLVRRYSTLRQASHPIKYDFMSPIIIPLQHSFLLKFYFESYVFSPHNRRILAIPMKRTLRDIVIIRSDGQQLAYFGDRSSCIHLQPVNGDSKEFETRKSITDIAYVPLKENIIIIASSSQISRFDTKTETFEPLAADILGIKRIALSLDGKTLIVRGTSTLSVFAMERNTLDFRIEVEDEGLYETVSIEPLADIKYEFTSARYSLLAHAVKNQFLATEKNNIVVINPRLSPPKQLFRLSHESKVIYQSYRPHSDEATTITENGEIYFWNIETQILISKQKLTYDFTCLTYSPQGEYLAIWGSEPYENQRDVAPYIQIWDANLRQCIHEIRLTQPAHGLVWLPNFIINAKGFPTYTFAFWERFLDCNIYEVNVIEESRLEIYLIWTSMRHTYLGAREYLTLENSVSEEAIPSLAPTLSISTRNNTFTFKISDYLSYRDYCHYLAFCGISAEECRTAAKRPLLNAEIWKKTPPVVNEQLQRLGFFSLQRPANIHQLTLQHVPADSMEDTYQSVQICEENGTYCGIVDVYLFSDMLRIN